MPDHINKIINANITIQDIKEYFRLHKYGPCFSMFESGLDGNRFDLIKINPYRQYIRIFEFKSCRTDFTSDKKWQNYLKYCHTFTFVCAREVIKREDLAPGIGLMWIFKWKWKQQSAWHLESEWISKPKKREIQTEEIARIAFMLVHRAKQRKEDVF